MCFCEFRGILRIYLNFVQKLTDTIMTSPEHEARKTVQRGQQRFDCWPELHLWVFIAIKRGNRPTRLLPHAKMLLVPISFFLRWVDYALEGSTFSLSKCDFSRLFHTERSWHTYRFTVVFVSGHRICLMQEDFLWPLLKYNLAFRCSWTRVLFFSKVHSGSELLNDFLWSVNVLFFSNIVSRWAQLVSFLCRMFKIITDSDLQIQNYKIEVQLKLKLHQLWRIALWHGKIQLGVFLKIVWVFWLERVVPPLVSFWITLTVSGLFCYCHIVIKSRAMCRPKSQWSDLSTVRFSSQ